MQNNQIVRFIVAGSINTLFYFMLYSILIYFGTSYVLAVFLATVAGVIFSFTTFKTYVFSHSKNAFFRFIVLYVILYFVNILAIKFFHTLIDSLYLCGLLATILAAIVSFILNKYFVFKKEKRE